MGLFYTEIKKGAKPMQQDITQHITLELNKPVDKAKICVKKNDTNSRRVQVTLTNNGGMVNLDNVVKAVVKGRKADGRTFYNDCTVVGDTIWFIITTQMINVAGQVECELEVTWLDETLVTTPAFYIQVYNTLNTGEQSQNEYTALTQMLAETINERQAAQLAQEAAENAQAMAELAKAAAEVAQGKAETAETNAEAAEATTIAAKNYTVEYIQNFIREIESQNPTLRLAKQYTDEQLAPIAAAEGDISDLQVPLATDLVGACNVLNNAVKGKQYALSYEDYDHMITALNDADDEAYKVGQSMYIVTLEVPDIWISGVAETSVPYTYVDDATLILDIATAHGALQVGYYYISQLETQKVDLTYINASIADIYAKLGYPIG